jgi:uncharacterized glyoxalase superfamily protein PhnB/predicted kinase
MTNSSLLVPLLVVRGARRAIDFYRTALGATVTACYEHGSERRVSHADLTLPGVVLAVTEEARGFNSDAPASLGGSPVVLQLRVPDTDAVVRAMCDAGACVVFPAQEFLGERMARVRDPFGHLWLLRQPLVELSVDEIQRARDALFAARGQSKPDHGDSQTPGEESPTVSNPTGVRQAACDEREMPAQKPTVRGLVHLVVGPVGAGKSTFAVALSRERAAVRLTLDDWFVTLFTPDRPESSVMEWYRERSLRCVEQIWKVAQEIVTAGTDAILELGLLRRSEREQLYTRAGDACIALKVYVLDAERAVRRERVLARNRGNGATFSMVVPAEVFELASDLWEPPEADEVQGLDVSFIRTDGACRAK